MNFNEFLQSDAHFLFHSARVVNMPTDVEQLGATVPLSTKPKEPLTTSPINSRSEADTQLAKLYLQIVGATATVSTLVTVVGQPNTPTSAGNGGFSLGFPCLPSRDSMRAVSSPQM